MKFAAMSSRTVFFQNFHQIRVQCVKIQFEQKNCLFASHKIYKKDVMNFFFTKFQSEAIHSILN